MTINFVEALEARGAAAINVSSGGSSPSAQVPVGPGYQIPLARAVKQATMLPVIAVGLITDFEQAESILWSGGADLIALARAMLYDPRWPWHAAAHMGTYPCRLSWFQHVCREQGGVEHESGYMHRSEDCLLSGPTLPLRLDERTKD